MYCKNCGAQMPDGAEFCAACGAHMKSSSEVPNQNLPVESLTPNIPPRQFHQPPKKNNTVIIGAIAAVAVVLIAAIVCFTVLTHGKQQAQLAQIQAEEQQAQREAEEKKEAEEKAAEEAEKQAEEEAKAKEEAEKKEEEAAKKQAEEEEEQQISSTTVNNYYYYNTGNPSDDYYTAVTSSGYLWPTDTQYITASDLSGLSRDTVAAIRNEIYARHGYAFQQERWQQYFAAKSWYYRDESCTESTVSSRLSSVEKTNIDTIVEYEKSMGWR